MEEGQTHKMSGKRDSPTTDTIIPACGFIKGLQNEQRFYHRNVDYERKRYSKQIDLLSCGECCSCQTNVRAG